MIPALLVMGAGLCLALSGCGRDSAGTSSNGAAAKPEAARIRMATTTSTENSGLLDALLPALKEATGIDVHVLSMGTGKALRTGESGDCDVLLVHAPEAEKEFVGNGFGLERHPVMFNDFVVLGPATDPAGIRGLTDVVAAMQEIRSTPAAVFCSRGDDSGTHKKERALWKLAGIDPGTGAGSSTAYLETGQGMGATLTQANERLAYTIADRGTYLAYRGKLDLEVLVEGDARLRNPYAVIAVNPERHPHVLIDPVRRFIDWLTGPEGQRRIGEFRVDGEVLFHPWDDT